MLARTYRLRNRKDVARVYRSGKTARSEYMALKWANNRHGQLRAAVVVSKKVASKAPVRNRIRRRIYELLRQDTALKEQPVDMIISVYSAEVATMPAAKLAEQFSGLLQKRR